MSQGWTKPALKAVVQAEEEIFADCCRQAEIRMNLFATWVARAWIGCILVAFYAQVKMLLTESRVVLIEYSVLYFYCVSRIDSLFLQVKQICNQNASPQLNGQEKRRVGRGRGWVFVRIILD